MIRCLILAHGFNMDGRAASHTITDKIPYLLAKGWKLFVLSAITGTRDQRFPHGQLLALGPAAFRFDFRHWFATRFGKGVPYKICTALVSVALLPLIVIERLIIRLPSQWSWAVPATVVGYFWIKKHDLNVIYSTGGSWSAHLAGRWLHRLTGVKWIVEFHDPMVDRQSSDDDGSAPRESREGRFRQGLEAGACRDADAIWWFTEGALQFARRRHPELGDRGFFVLPGAEPSTDHRPYSKGAHLNIAHFGSLADNRSLSHLLFVLPDFFKRIAGAQSALRVHVYGADLDTKSKEMIARLQLQANVICHGRLEKDTTTGISGRTQVIQLMEASDFLLLLHGDYEGCAEYIPSKLYEYWWAGRPILAVNHKNPQLDELVDAINQQRSLRSRVHDADSVLQMLSSAWALWTSPDIENFHPPSPRSVADAVDEIASRTSLEH